MKIVPNVFHNSVLNRDIEQEILNYEQGIEHAHLIATIESILKENNR